MSCSICFTDFIANCTTTVKVNAILVALSGYTWIITDKFGSKYSGDVVTDADGHFEIPVADLPDGLLNSYAGDFILEIQDHNCSPIKFLIAKEYSCINFTVSSGTFVKDELGCPVDCETPVS